MLASCSATPRPLTPVCCGLFFRESQLIVGSVSSEAKVVGFAMYYFTYDPWIGKQLYLEDFYITDEYRGGSFVQVVVRIKVLLKS